MRMGCSLPSPLGLDASLGLVKLKMVILVLDLDTEQDLLLAGSVASV